MSASMTHSDQGQAVTLTPLRLAVLSRQTSCARILINVSNLLTKIDGINTIELLEQFFGDISLLPKHVIKQ
jgi:hypothetical protein